MARVVSIINYKGGVGKSTTTYHVGCSLAEHHNKRVLLLDIDPQTNLTFLCSGQKKWQDRKASHGTIKTIYDRFQAKQPLQVHKYIWQSPVGEGRQKIGNLDIIPCDIELLGEDLGGGQIGGTFSSMQQLIRTSDEFVRERSFLDRVIREVEDRYDYVLIDCPPNLYLMTQNALFASNEYVITAIPDHLSTIGLTTLVDKVSRIGRMIDNAKDNAGIADQKNVGTLGGVIFTKVRPTNMHNSTMEAIANQDEFEIFWGKCFRAHTSELIGFSDAAENSLPVWHTNTTTAKYAADKREYETISREFMRRFPA